MADTIAGLWEYTLFSATPALTLTVSSMLCDAHTLNHSKDWDFTVPLPLWNRFHQWHQMSKKPKRKDWLETLSSKMRVYGACAPCKGLKGHQGVFPVHVLWPFTLYCILLMQWVMPGQEKTVRFLFFYVFNRQTNIYSDSFHMHGLWSKTFLKCSCSPMSSSFNANTLLNTREAAWASYNRASQRTCFGKLQRKQISGRKPLNFWTFIDFHWIFQKTRGDGDVAVVLSANAFPAMNTNTWITSCLDKNNRYWGESATEQINNGMRH